VEGGVVVAVVVDGIGSRTHLNRSAGGRLAHAPSTSSPLISVNTHLRTRITTWIFQLNLTNGQLALGVHLKTAFDNHQLEKARKAPPALGTKQNPCTYYQKFARTPITENKKASNKLASSNDPTTRRAGQLEEEKQQLEGRETEPQPSKGKQPFSA